MATIRTGSWLPSALAVLSRRNSDASVEAVARLDLDRGAAAGHQRVEAAARADASSSPAELAALVAATVEAMPPPALAISS